MMLLLMACAEAETGDAADLKWGRVSDAGAGEEGSEGFTVTLPAPPIMVQVEYCTITSGVCTTVPAEKGADETLILVRTDPALTRVNVTYLYEAGTERDGIGAEK